MEKMILNPSTSAQNVVDNVELEKVTRMTLAQLVRKLLKVSGPYSRNAFILKNTGTLLEGSNTQVLGKYTRRQEFTRDGIGTLQAIEYASPIQRYIKDEILSWIGQRIDAVCHDGTTTSMLFTASFLIALLDAKKDLQFKTNTEIETAYDEVVADIKEHLKKFKITTARLLECNQVLKEDNLAITPEQARVLIATMQAYTSSAGRADLTKAVATVIAHSPSDKENSTSGINYRTPTVETEEVGIRAVQDDYEFSIPATTLSHHLFNTNRNTEFVAEKADVLVLRTGFSRDTMTGIGLMNHLGQHKERYQDGRYFVLMIPSQAGNTDIQYLEDLCNNLETEGVKVFIGCYMRPIGYNVSGPFWYYMDALNAKADVPDVNELVIGEMEFSTVEPYLIKDVKVKADAYQMYFNNVIPWNRISSNEQENLKSLNTHPGEVHPTLYPNYTATKQFFNECIATNIANVREATENVVVDLRRALAAMSTDRQWYVEIMGKTHDVEMYKSVIKDAAGAAMIALQDGVYFNGPVKLFCALSELITDPKYLQHPDPVKGVILVAMLTAAKDMFYAMYSDYAWQLSNTFESLIGEANKPYGYVNVSEDVRLTKMVDSQPFSFLNEETKRIYGATIMSLNAPEGSTIPFITYIKSVLWPDKLDKEERVITPPCQVGNLFDVLFHRLREVTLRLVLTDQLIAPDAMWDDGSLIVKKAN